MTYKEKRDHKFKILFMYDSMKSDIDTICMNYFANAPYEEEDNDNSYINDVSKAHKNVAKIRIDEEDNIIENESDKAIYISLDHDDDVRDIKNKVKDLISKTDEIDKLIKDSLKSWDISRVGKAELTIIRLALYEIYFDKSIDAPVAINEAVELSKVYGDDKASKFVNGVLSTIYNHERSTHSITT